MAACETLNLLINMDGSSFINMDGSSFWNFLRFNECSFVMSSYTRDILTEN